MSIRLITHHYSLDEAPEAYQAMAGGKTGKAVFEYSGKYPP